MNRRSLALSLVLSSMLAAVGCSSGPADTSDESEELTESSASALAGTYRSSGALRDLELTRDGKGAWRQLRATLAGEGSKTYRVSGSYRANKQTITFRFEDASPAPIVRSGVYGYRLHDGRLSLTGGNLAYVLESGASVPETGPACGPNICGAGEECCNASCGICTPPGGGCIQMACAPEGAACGANVCGAGEECCNASCGICAPQGGGCIQMECGPSAQ